MVARSVGADLRRSRSRQRKRVLVGADVVPPPPFNGWVIMQPYPELPQRDIHQCFEIGVALSGRQDGYFDDFVTQFGPGDVYLVPAWEPHGGRTTAPDSSLLVLHFFPEFLGDEAFDGRSWLSFFACPPRDRPRVADPSLRKHVLAMSAEMSREIDRKRPGWLTAARLITLRLLFEVSREWQPAETPGRRASARPGNLARIAPAMELVHMHPEGRLSLREAAAACALSVSQFSLIFRQTMGLSFGVFAARSRLTHAARLLLSTDWPHDAIAERLGFVDASHFHHAFVKLHATTPARYREQGLRTRHTAARQEAWPGS